MSSLASSYRLSWVVINESALGNGIIWEKWQIFTFWNCFLHLPNRYNKNTSPCPGTSSSKCLSPDYSSFCLLTKNLTANVYSICSYSRRNILICWFFFTCNRLWPIYSVSFIHSHLCIEETGWCWPSTPLGGSLCMTSPTQVPHTSQESTAVIHAYVLNWLLFHFLAPRHLEIVFYANENEECRQGRIPKNLHWRFQGKWQLVPEALQVL